MTSRLRAAWEHFWFRPGAALDLGAARVVVSLFALWHLASRDLPALSGLPAPFWSAVAAGARWRFLLFEGRPALERGLEGLAFLALGAAALGVFARPACLLAGLLLYHLAPLETLIFSPAPTLKGFTLPVLALVALAATPCDDALALRPGPCRAPPWEHGWGLRLVQVFVAQAYLAAAWARLARSGAAALGGAEMESWLRLLGSDDELTVFRTFGPWLAAEPWRAQVAAAAVPLLLLAMGALPWLSGRLRSATLAAALLFHAAVLAAANLAFTSGLLLLVFVDWSGTAGVDSPRARALVSSLSLSGGLRDPSADADVDPGP